MHTTADPNNHIFADPSRSEDPDLTCTPDPSKTIRYTTVGPGSAGRSYSTAKTLYRKFQDADWNPWYPFVNGNDFELACWMMESGLTKTDLDICLDHGLDGDRCQSFQTANELWTKLEGLDFGLGPASWACKELQMGTLYKRDLIGCIQLLLRHLPFADHLTYEPVHYYNSQGRRIFNEIHSGDWWWEKQSHIRAGGTLIPLICASDKTCLTNFSGDKSAWPPYISLGNISKAIRRHKSKRAWILVALLPVPPKDPEAGAIHTIWHDAVDDVFQCIKGLSLEGPGFEWDCADGQVHHCFPVIAAWIADYQEHVIIARLKNGGCPSCEIPISEMGHENGPKCGPQRFQSEYIELLANAGSEKQTLEDRLLKPVPNMLWDYPLCDVYQLWMVDILHQLYLNVLKKLMEWLIPFLKTKKLYQRFNKRFKSIPAYPGFQRFTKAYSDVSQWQGKELRTMAHFLLVAVGPLLAPKKRTLQAKQREELEALKCVRSLCEFMLILGQRSHSEYSISLLNKELVAFYRYKAVFRGTRATNTRTTAFQRLWEEKLREAGGSWSNKRKESERKKLEVEVYHFAFPKMHFLSHVCGNIRRMGSSDNYSTDILELLHIENVKNAYRASNHVDYIEQMLFYNDRHLGLAYMVQTLEHLALRGHYRPESAKVLGLQGKQDRLATTRAVRRKEKVNNRPAVTRSEVPQAYSDWWANEVPTPRVAGPLLNRKSMTLEEAEVVFDIPDLGSCFLDWIVESWGSTLVEKVCRSSGVFKYQITIYNGVSFWYWPFQKLCEVLRQLLKCPKDKKKKEQGKTADHAIWVRQFESHDTDSFQGRKACFPLLYFGYTPPVWVLKDPLATIEKVPRVDKVRWVRGNRICTTKPLEMGFVMVQGTKFVHSSSMPDPAHGFVEVAIDKKDIYVTPIGSIEGPVQLVEENEEARIKTWLVNNHIDLETYYYVY